MKPLRLPQSGARVPSPSHPADRVTPPCRKAESRSQIRYARFRPSGDLRQGTRDRRIAPGHQIRAIAVIHHERKRPGAPRFRRQQTSWTLGRRVFWRPGPDPARRVGSPALPVDEMLLDRTRVLPEHQDLSYRRGPGDDVGPRARGRSRPPFTRGRSPRQICGRPRRRSTDPRASGPDRIRNLRHPASSRLFYRHDRRGCPPRASRQPFATHAPRLRPTDAWRPLIPQRPRGTGSHPGVKAGRL